MKNKHKRRDYSYIIDISKGILALLIVISFLYVFVFNNYHFIGKKSVNSGAKSYKTKTCLAFYPEGKEGKDMASKLCSSVSKDEEMIFDYALIPSGDYYLVEYGNNNHYYIDHNGKALKIEKIDDNSKNIISDYLRYDMKKAEIDEAYSLNFLKETSPSNIDLSNCTYKIEGADLAIYFPQYDFKTYIPIQYIEESMGIDLGYNIQKYVKPKYVSNKRKVVAITFDDGPNTTTSKEIIDTFYNYDSNATFFIQGVNISSKTIDIISSSIEKGNQYGSHSQSHPSLPKLNNQEIYDEIMSPANDLYYGYQDGSKYSFDGLQYTMTCYRPPYGIKDDRVNSVAPLISITWDCDSQDWATRDAKAIINEIERFKDNNKDGLNECIVLCHDTYEETALAMQTLVPKLIDEGYQLVTIDELLNRLNISKSVKDSYPW